MSVNIAFWLLNEKLIESKTFDKSWQLLCFLSAYKHFQIISNLVLAQAQMLHNDKYF